MINQARTLLLNKDGSTRPDSSFYLEEYVDPTYSRLTLPRDLAQFYRILINEGSDDAFANFRLRQYMCTIHSTIYSSYVYDLDPRVTYINDKAYLSMNTKTVLPRNANAAAREISFIDEPVIPNVPRLFQSWDVEVTALNTIKTTNTNTGHEATTVVTITDGLTSAFDFADQRLFKGKVTAGSLPVGTKWLVTVFLNPTQDLSDVMQSLGSLSRGTIENLFLNEEPYLTFKDLWFNKAFIPDRLTGLLLGYIYRVEDVRLNG